MTVRHVVAINVLVRNLTTSAVVVRKLELPVSGAAVDVDGIGFVLAVAHDAMHDGREERLIKDNVLVQLTDYGVALDAATIDDIWNFMTLHPDEIRVLDATARTTSTKR